MAKEYLELPSFLKQRVSDAILDQIQRNMFFHLIALEKFVSEANPKITTLPSTMGGFITAVPEDSQDKVILLWNMFKKSDTDLERASWYISRLLLTAKDITTIRDCIPEYYWKYLRRLNLTGSASTQELYLQDCYDILEQAQINNLLLGITNS